MIGITPKQLGSIERGQQKVTAYNLLRLSVALEMPIDRLFCKYYDKPEPGNADYYRNMIDNFVWQLDERILEFVTLMLKGIVKATQETNT